MFHPTCLECILLILTFDLRSRSLPISTTRILSTNHLWTFTESILGRTKESDNPKRGSQSSTMIERRWFRTMRKIQSCCKSHSKRCKLRGDRGGWSPFLLSCWGLEPRFDISNDWNMLYFILLLHIKALCHLEFAVTPLFTVFVAGPGLKRGQGWALVLRKGKGISKRAW